MSIFCLFWGFVVPFFLNKIYSGHGCISQQFTEQDTVLTISCPIASFTATGSWYVDNVGPKTSCGANAFCSITIDGNYSFTSNTSGMYAKIDPFASYEIGKVWKCDHSTLNNCILTVSGPQDSSSGGGSTDWETPTIVTVVIVLLLIPTIICCCIFNLRCKYGYVCEGSKFSFTFPSENGSKVNITPERKLGDKEGTPNKENISSDKLSNGKSSIAAFPQRSGANQTLYPLIKGEGGNVIRENLPK